MGTATNDTGWSALKKSLSIVPENTKPPVVDMSHAKGVE